MRFLLKYPSRSRPALFCKRVHNWRSLASGEHQLHWLCSFDNDDAAMRTAVIRRFCEDYKLQWHYGPNRSKVQAINAGLDMIDLNQFDICILVSDDMAAIQPGWDHIVATEMQAAFPDLNGALWFPDGNQNRLCTLSIMGRPVLQELGHFYHPAFKSVYCDNYYHDLMVKSNRLKFVDLPVFRHEWRKENNDSLMRRNEGANIHLADKATYERMAKELAGG